MIVLAPDIEVQFARNAAFDAIMQLDGQVFRHHKHRRTVRTCIGDKFYFVKTHGPTGWGEILKNALRGRWPVLTSQTEWRAIQRLEELRVPTTHAVGCGVRGRWPHRLESFIITQELSGMIHLDELAEKLQPLERTRRMRIVRLLTCELARISRILHNNGLNHRDYYLCHFMVKDRDWAAWDLRDKVTVHVIDLHRMQVRQRTPVRWAIKDISGLLFSTLDANLGDRDYLRFLRVYWGAQDKSLREAMRDSSRWRKRVVRRAVSLYQAEHGKPPRLPAGLASFA